MLTFPNAKINIGLFITGKRTDNYHNLETIFYPVPIKDALEIIDYSISSPSLNVTGIPVAGNAEKNLAWKALTLLQKDFPDNIKPISIHLHKLIPMGAGLGGGSADGAFMLLLLNDHFQLGLNQQQLEQYALTLGSDCPFFIQNKPAFASGRGEELETISLDLSDYSIQLVCPEIHISTVVAFAEIKPRQAAYDLRQIANLPITDWKENISNDFERVLFPKFPELKLIKDELYAQGALYASLSGTGSTVYGIFKKGNQASIHSGIPCMKYYFK